MAGFDRSMAAHAQDLTRLAYLLGHPQDRAAEAAAKAIVRTLGNWHDLRHSDQLETCMLRALVRSTRRGIRMRRPGVEGEGAADWRLLKKLPYRQRAAYVLSSFAELDAAGIADVLQCSESAARSLTSRAQTTLGRELDLPTLAAAIGPSPTPIRAFGPRVARRKSLVAVATAASVTLTAVAAYAAATGRLAPDQPAPSASPSGVDHAIQIPPVLHEGLSRCPAVAGSLHPGKGALNDAASVATHFARAVMSSDNKTFRSLVDDGARDQPIEEWAHTRTRAGLFATGSDPASEDRSVTAACGQAVAQRSWKVYVHDRTFTSGEGLAIFYLIRRPDGWRVWGSYKPGA